MTGGVVTLGQRGSKKKGGVSRKKAYYCNSPLGEEGAVNVDEEQKKRY